MKNVLIAFTISFFGLQTHAQNINDKKINDYLNSIEKKNLDVGSLSISKDGKEVYQRNFGIINGQTYTKNSTYQVGSVTKLFTAILIWKLIEDKQLSLETRLSAFYPDIENSNLITIKNLLEHTSGLSNYIKKVGNPTWLGELRSDKEILDEIKAQKNLFKPNDSVFYSNSGYYVLGKIVEKKYKDNYGNIVKKQITQPLKLTNTHSTLDNPVGVSKSMKLDNGNWVEKSDFNFKNIIGVGDISSNPTDLNKLINLLFDNKILKKESLEQLKPIIGKEIYGRGTMNFNIQDILFYGNTGATSGSAAKVMYDPKAKISIAICLNAEQYERDRMIEDLVRIIYKDALRFPN
jgi:D-alanyl-D-alanine carboxypeptidase